MSTAAAAFDQCVILDRVRWDTYVALCDETEDRRGRMAYDRGLLEIMSPSMPHERVGRLIGRMVEAFTEELELDIVSVKSTTFRRQDREQGFEADESYYVANAAAVREKETIDLTSDPPPDLVIEVDMSHSSRGKFGIYGGLGVPEVWRYHDEELRVHISQGQEYAVVSESHELPGFPLDEMMRLLAQRHARGENELLRSFRRYVRQHLTGP